MRLVIATGAISRRGWRRPSSGAAEAIVAECRRPDRGGRRAGPPRHLRGPGRLFRRPDAAEAAICGFGPPGCSSSSSPTRGDDPALRREVDVIAPALRAHIDAQIAAAPQASGALKDDVLGRCLALQAEGRAGLHRHRDPHRAHRLRRRRAATAADGGAAGAGAAPAPARGAGRGAGGRAPRRRHAARRLRARGDALRPAGARRCRVWRSWTARSPPARAERRPCLRAPPCWSPSPRR